MWAAYPRYKDSGLPWVGRVPEHWAIRRNRFLFREVDSRSVHGKEEHLSMSQAHGLVSSKSLKRKSLQSENYAGGKLVSVNDLVLNRLKAHLGVFAISKQAGVVSPDYTVLRPNRTADVNYCELLFKTPAYVAEFRRRTKGIVEGFWRLYADDFYDVHALFPPLPEQTQIATYLRTQDAKIARFIRIKRELIDKLNEQKLAVIDHAVTQGLNPDAPRKPSGVAWLGEVPKHWEVLRLRRLVKYPIKNGVGESAQEFRENWPRYVRITDIASPTSLYEEKKASLPPEIANLAPLKAGDLLCAAVGATFGKSYLHKTEKYPCCYAGFLVRVSPDELLNSEFLLNWTQSNFYWNQLNSQVIQATIQNFSAAKYKDLFVPVPPLAEQHAILAHIKANTEPLATAIHQAEQEISLIREYRERLILDAVTGQIDLRDWEARADERADDVDLLALTDGATEENNDDDAPISD